MSLPSLTTSQMGRECTKSRPSVCVQPHVYRVAEEVYAAYPVGYLWAYASFGSGEHPKGLALDFSVLEYRTPTVGGPADMALGNSIARYLWANRLRLHVWYVIWNRRIISTNRGSYAYGRWVGYSGSSPHTDHVHVSFYADRVYTPPTEPPVEVDEMTPDDLEKIRDLVRAEVRTAVRDRDNLNWLADVVWWRQNRDRGASQAWIASRTLDASAAARDETKALTATLLDHIAQGAGVDPTRLKADVAAAVEAGVKAGLRAEADEFATAVLTRLGDVQVSTDAVVEAIRAVLREGVDETDQEETTS